MGSEKSPLNLQFLVLYRDTVLPKLWDRTTEIGKIPAGETED
jgi:hypothetical protein